jgi:inosine/xanthosine triphosphatase
MIIAVGSTNPTKTDPVKAVFSHYFPNVSVKGVKVPSGVSEQPKNINTMFTGALNRAQNALKKVRSAQYGVGIEGGMHKYKHGWFESSIVVIIDRNGKVGIGSSGGFVLPSRIIKDIETGKTLEESMDGLFNTRNIGEIVGTTGVFTRGLVTRTDGVKHGVAFALARFLHDELYSL